MTFTRRQLERLVEKAAAQVDPGETVLDVTVGAVHLPHPRRRNRYQAKAMSVLVTDRRLLLFRSRLRGHEVHFVAYPDIRAVGHSRGGRLGELQLTIAGRDVLRISSMPADDVDRIAQLVRDRISA